jgi:signal transduction histidine kinase
MDPESVALAAWLGRLGIPLGLTVLPLVLLLFPTGRPPSRRWRFFEWGGWYLVVAMTLTAAFQGGPIGGPWTAVGREVLTPFGFSIEDLGPVSIILDLTQSWVLMAVILASLVAPIWRYRGAARDERRQLRWMALIPTVTLAAFVLGIVVSTLARDTALNDLLGGFYWGIMPYAIFAAIPIAAGIAIVRHGLYEVEVVIRKAVVFALVVAALTAVLFLVAVALPILAVGRGGSTLRPLPLLIGVALGLLVVPFTRIARRVADRLVYRGRATPYEVLGEFAQRVGETYSIDDVLPRMAHLLAQGTGATEARVWLRGRDGRLRAEAAWPVDAAPTDPVRVDADEPSFDGWSAVFPVRHQAELLGALTLRMSAADPMNDTKERLAQEVANQAGLVLRNLALIGDLRDSRRRIVTAQDERARQLERNIHDGAQQQLVALAVKLRLADSFVGTDETRAHAMLAELQTDTSDALENLRDLARGIYPPLLADKGLAVALESQARKAAVPTTVEAEGVGRYPPEVEATVYFSCLEALNNVAKYARATVADVRLTQRDGHLVFQIRDDGVGFDPVATGYGTGLQGMADRLAAIGGTLEILSGDEGTTVAGRLPVEG